MSKGFDVSSITFNESGEIIGLGDDVLASISAGALSGDFVLEAVPTNGSGCNNSRCSVKPT